MKFIMKLIKEACIDNIDSVNLALNSGKISRFETCSNLNEGGLTPDMEVFEYIQNNCDFDQIIMIRPTNTFIVNDESEVETMKLQILNFLNKGGRHFIFGYIDQNRNIDWKICEQLIAIIKTYSNTTWSFHMAIDEVNDYDKAFKELIQHKFVRVLTKGGQGAAVNNLQKLKYLQTTYGKEIEILVGGKVTKDNYEYIHEQTNICQFHGTKIF